jgi:hypothetical protein
MSMSVRKAGNTEDRNTPRSAPENPQRESLRRCLMCGDQFSSFGPGNRICKKCKSTETWRRG